MRGASFERPVSVAGQVATGTDELGLQPSDHRLVRRGTRRIVRSLGDDPP